MEVEQARLRSTLHRRGMRMTPQRQLVLDAVRALEHATPEQIHRRVRAQASTVNLSTVYRNLDVLEELGLLVHTQIGDGAPTYSAAGHRHVHLLCRSCGRLDEAPADVLDGLSGTLRTRAGFVLDTDHVALSGHCTDCAADAAGHDYVTENPDTEPDQEHR